MPRRRVFGSVLRRTRQGAAALLPGAARFYPGWYARVRHRRKEIIRYAGADRATALAYLKKLQSDIERRELLGEIAPSEMTFSEFAEEYVAHCKHTHTRDTYASRRSTVRGVLCVEFGSRRLQDIRRADIERFFTRRMEHWAPATRNRYLSILSAMYKRAIALGYVLESPTRGIERLKEPRIPLPLIPLGDQDRLLAAMPERLRLLVLLAMDTGARLGELLRLEWADVDLSAGTLLVRKSKNHRPRLLHLSKRLSEALTSHRPTGTPPTELRLLADVTGTDGRLKAAAFREYKAVAGSVGYPALRFHDLRHTNATLAAASGAPLRAVMHRLGHASAAAALRYQHRMAGQDEAIAEFLHGIVTEPRADFSPVPRAR